MFDRKKKSLTKDGKRPEGMKEKGAAAEGCPAGEEPAKDLARESDILLMQRWGEGEGGGQNIFVKGRNQ